MNKKITLAPIISLLFISCSSDSSPEEPENNPEVSSVEVSTYSSITAPDALELDDSGNLFAANYGQSQVYKIEPDRTVSTFLTDQPGAAGMAFDSEGYMYLARYDNADIVKVSPDGSNVEVFAEEVAAPIEVAFDSEGNLYTNNNVNNFITEIDSDGNKRIRSLNVFNNSSLAIDDQDNIFVSDYTSGRISRIDAETGNRSTFTTIPISQDGIGYIIFSNGKFYATAISDNVVYEIDQDGTSKIIAGKTGVSGTMDGNGNTATFSNPIGIAASKDGKTLFIGQSGAIRMVTGF
ncbi:MAG: DUF5050 domain-containing protein [Bacteroidota bacterium]